MAGTFAFYEQSNRVVAVFGIIKSFAGAAVGRVCIRHPLLAISGDREHDDRGTDLRSYRVRGLSDVLNERGLALDGRHNMGLDPLSMVPVVIEFLSIGIDAVCAFNDESAACFIDAAKKIGTTIPTTMRVIGIDNEIFGDFLTPSLTTVDYVIDTVNKYVDMILSACGAERPMPETDDSLLSSVKVIQRESA